MDFCGRILVWSHLLWVNFSWKLTTILLKIALRRNVVCLKKKLLTSCLSYDIVITRKYCWGKFQYSWTAFRRIKEYKVLGNATRNAKMLLKHFLCPLDRLCKYFPFDIILCTWTQCWPEKIFVKFRKISSESYCREIS